MEYDSYLDQDFSTDANKCLNETTIYTKSAAQELRREIHNRVHEIMCNLPDGVVFRILHFYRWREDHIIEMFLRDVVQLLKIVRIPKPELVSICHKIPSLPDQIVCPRCLVEIKDFDHLGCGHFFCRPCWRLHLESELAQVPSRELPCMADKCSHPISESFVRKLGLSSKTLQLFEEYLYVRFIARKGLSPCQAAGCTNVIENPIREGDALVCICSCGHRFCPRCPAGYHSPLSCDALKAITLQQMEVKRAHQPGCCFAFDWELKSNEDFIKQMRDIISRADSLNINIDISFLQEFRGEVVYGRPFLEYYTFWMESFCTPAEKALHSFRRDSYAPILKALNDSLLQFLAVPSEQALERMKQQKRSLISMRKKFLD